MLRGRLPLLGGALTLLNIRILEEILSMVLLLQPAASAICDIDSSPLRIISLISSCFEGARFSAVLVVAWLWRSPVRSTKEEDGCRGRVWRCQMYSGVSLIFKPHYFLPWTAFNTPTYSYCLLHHPRCNRLSKRGVCAFVLSSFQSDRAITLKNREVHWFVCSSLNDNLYQRKYHTHSVFPNTPTCWACGSVICF